MNEHDFNKKIITGQISKLGRVLKKSQKVLLFKNLASSTMIDLISPKIGDQV